MSKKLAICFYGHLRTYETTCQYFLKNIIEINKKDGWEIDIFMHTWDVFQEKNHTRHTPDIEKLYPTLLNRPVTEQDISKLKEIYNIKKVTIENGTGMFRSVKKVSSIVLEYQNENNMHYDFMLYTRPDIMFFSPLKLDKYISFYLEYVQKAFNDTPKNITWCVNNYYSALPHQDPRFANEGDLCWINNFYCEDIPPRKSDNYFVVIIKYSHYIDFVVYRETTNINKFRKNLPYSIMFKEPWIPNTWPNIMNSQKQLIEKDNLINALNSEKQKLEQDKNQQIQNLTNERNSLHNEKTQLQNELNSIPTKKANLEVLNLEQDLINKKLQSKKLAKEIGVKLDVLMPKITLISANSAKARIHSHLSYKLGSALIANSKSILGYIRMPFILMAISIAHKEQNKNLKLAKDKLPPLESYADYQEALKEKECFTYKLGKAFIKAHKNWYGGGVYQILLPRCA